MKIKNQEILYKDNKELNQTQDNKNYEKTDKDTEEKSGSANKINQ